jgi:hypothetical protein
VFENAVRFFPTFSKRSRHLVSTILRSSALKTLVFGELIAPGKRAAGVDQHPAYREMSGLTFCW